MSDGMDRGGTTDPFDDFDFKPLTEGLGFHKKAEKIKADVKSATLTVDTTAPAKVIPDPPPKMSASDLLRPSAAETMFNESPSALLTREMAKEPAREAARSEAKPASQSISDLIASLPPSLDFVDDNPLKTPAKASKTPAAPSSASSRPQIFQPLGRDEFKIPTTPQEPVRAPAAGPTIGSVLPTPGTKAGGVSTAAAIAAPLATTSPYREKIDESYAKAFPHADTRTPRPQTATAAPTAGATVGASAGAYRQTAVQPGTPVAHNMAGAILDSMVVLGISTIFLVCILAITHVNIVGLLTNANTDVSTQFHLAFLFLAVLQMYMLTSRSFFGASLGDWAFDLQIGRDDQRSRPTYPIQVAWRSLFMTLTGFIVVPLLSLVLKRDLAKPVTGLELLRRP